MIYTAKELGAYLTYLTLEGQYSDGSLHFVGDDKRWRVVTWIIDGAYDDLSDKGAGAIETYLNL